MAQEDFPLASGRLPLVGHVHQMIRDMPRLMRRARRENGPIFQIDFGLGQRFLVIGERSAYELLKNRVVSSDIFNEAAGPIVEGSLMGMDGRPHRRARRAMGGPFSPAGLREAQVGELIAAETRAMISGWSAQAPCKLVRDTRELALSIVFQLIGAPAENLAAWSKRYFALIFGGGRIPGPIAWRGRAAQRWIDGRLAEVVERCRDEGDRESLVGALAHGETDEGDLLAVGELVPSLRLLVLAGHETSATAITWCLIELAERPALWDRLVDEVRAVERAPRSPQELNALPFAGALVREVLRAYTPAPIVLRRSTEPVEIDGHRLPAGTPMILPLYLLNLDTEAFPDPDDFRPERWLDDELPAPLFQNLPFGAGPHLCLGMHLARLEITHVVAAVAKEFGERGLRPSRRGRPRPRSSWFPLAHPRLRTRLWWEPA